MNKSILTLAISAILSSSMVIMAQEPSEEMPPMPPQGGYNTMPVRVIGDNPLIRNLNLTEEQKAKLEAIENPFLPMSMEKRAAKNREAKSPQDMAQTLEQGREQVQEITKSDTENSETVPVLREGRLGSMHSDNVEELALLRNEYLRKVKKILTEDQYIKYLENLLMYSVPDNSGSMGNFPAVKMHNRGPRAPHTRGNTKLIR